MPTRKYDRLEARDRSPYADPSRSLKKVRGLRSAPGSPSLHRSRAPKEHVAPCLPAREFCSREPRGASLEVLAAFISDLLGSQRQTDDSGG